MSDAVSEDFLGGTEQSKVNEVPGAGISLKLCAGK
jgi:hypothetical protein